MEDGKQVLNSSLNPDPTEVQSVHEMMTRKFFLTAKTYNKKACLLCEVMGGQRDPWEQSEPRPAPPIGVGLNSQFLHVREPKGHKLTEKLIWN